MNRTSLSMRRLGARLRVAGARPEYFGYVPSFETVDSIVHRLVKRLEGIAGEEYAVVGHSLGGLLLRSAIAALPPAARKPRALVMLGTPHRSPRLARLSQRYLPFRIVNGDEGRLLASEERMAAVPLPTVPFLVVAGNGGSRSAQSPFRGEENDGIVAVEEARVPGTGIGDTVVLPVRHTFMMNHPEVVAAVVKAVTAGLPAAP